jgi:hypothetical protein
MHRWWRAWSLDDTGFASKLTALASGPGKEHGICLQTDRHCRGTHRSDTIRTASHQERLELNNPNQRGLSGETPTGNFAKKPQRPY